MNYEEFKANLVLVVKENHDVHSIDGHELVVMTLNDQLVDVAWQAFSRTMIQNKEKITKE